jgi:hypothetical protein
MPSTPAVQPIVVYVIERHPLERPDSPNRFTWLHTDNGYRRELEGLLGPYDPSQTSILVDPYPAGPAWRDLLAALMREQVRAVVTHLAPLTSAQRQQLIGVCAQSGAHLITPADAGRNRHGEAVPSSL